MNITGFLFSENGVDCLRCAEDQFARQAENRRRGFPESPLPVISFVGDVVCVSCGVSYTAKELLGASVAKPALRPPGVVVKFPVAAPPSAGISVRVVKPEGKRHRRMAIADVFDAVEKLFASVPLIIARPVPV